MTWHILKVTWIVWNKKTYCNYQVGEYRRLKHLIVDWGTATDQLYLAAARIHLHSFYFFDSSTSESRKAGIMKAYNSAINLASVFISANRTREALLYLPYYHFRCLLTASCILLKVLKSSYAQGIDDFESGRKAFNDSLLSIGCCSVSNNDSAGKAVNMLSLVWHSNGAKNSPPQLSTKSKFGAR
jgi:hypothetical protein